MRSRLMICFFLLTVADLLLTGWLLSGEGPFFEANPLAAWCLERFGWAGLAGLKTVSFLLAAGGIAVLARRRPRVAQGTLALGCLAVGLVVFRGASLVATPALREQYRQQQASQARADAEARALKGRLERSKISYELRCRLSRELLAGRRSLESAITELEGLGAYRYPEWQRLAAALHPGKSFREVLEFQLLDQLLEDLKEGTAEGPRWLGGFCSGKHRNRGCRAGRYGLLGKPLSRPW